MTVDLHLNVAEVVDGAWDAGKTDLHGMYSKGSRRIQTTPTPRIVKSP